MFKSLLGRLIASTRGLIFQSSPDFDDMVSLQGKVCVITGASSGIGAAAAVELAKHGAKLMLHGRKETALRAVAASCVQQGIKKDDVSYVLGDLDDPDTITKIKETTLDYFGRIDVLFNNAGYIHPTDGPIHKGGTVDALDAMYRVTMRAPYMLVQAFIPTLEKTRGVVINCSSGYSRVPDPNLTAYCTTKAAMDHLTRLLALSLGPRGIRVNALNPGYVPTDIVRRKFGDEVNSAFMEQMASMSPLDQKLATPSQIGQVVVFLASDESGSLTGETVFCDMGVTLTNPIVDIKQFK